MRVNYKLLGKRIQAVRKQRHISQTELSERIDKSPSYISYIENGRKSMSLDTFAQIANALQVSADSLLWECFADRYAGNGEMEDLLADCSRYERLVILGTVQTLKTILRQCRE